MNDPKTESARWLTRLDGRESAADRAAFERWMSDPEHAVAHQKIEQLWQDMGQLSELPEFQQLSAQVLAKTDPDAPGGFRSPVALALAASLAVCVLTVGAFIAGHYYLPSETYVTAAGQRSTVQLEDGSKVVMNVATRLDVKLGRDRREFTLKHGEAVFTVAEDPTRPFTVQAGDGEVTALGTRFQVRNESRNIVVTLLEGRVALDRADKGQRVQLNPGDQVRFSVDATEMSRRRVNADAAASWTTGYLRFEGAELTEVLQEVNRYSATKLRVEDAALAKTRVDGVFEVGDAASVVSALQLMLPLETAARGRQEIVLVRKINENKLNEK